MTPDEFQVWFKHHGCLFPSFFTWLSSRPEEWAEITLRAYRDILSTVSLSAAKEASTAMYESQTRVRLDSHVAEVKRRAREPVAVVADWLLRDLEGGEA